MLKSSLSSLGDNHVEDLKITGQSVLLKESQELQEARVSGSEYSIHTCTSCILVHESGLTTGEQKRANAYLRATCPMSRSNGATAVKVSIAAICAFVLRAPPTAADSVNRNTSAPTTPVLKKIETSTNDWPHICMAAGGKLLQWRTIWCPAQEAANVFN